MRFVLICLLGFPDFFHIQELLQIKLTLVQIKESQDILVPKSKTDEHSEGHIVYISRIESGCCPVKTLEEHFKIGKALHPKE